MNRREFLRKAGGVAAAVAIAPMFPAVFEQLEPVYGIDLAAPGAESITTMTFGTINSGTIRVFGWRTLNWVQDDHPDFGVIYVGE